MFIRFMSLRGIIKRKNFDSLKNELFTYRVALRATFTDGAGFTGWALKTTT